MLIFKGMFSETRYLYVRTYQISSFWSIFAMSDFKSKAYSDSSYLDFQLLRVRLCSYHQRSVHVPYGYYLRVSQISEHTLKLFTARRHHHSRNKLVTFSQEELLTCALLEMFMLLEFLLKVL